MKLGLVDRDGNEEWKSTTPGHFNEHKETSFTVKAGEKEAKLHYGWASFVKQPELDRYVFNDMLTMGCLLKYNDSL